MSQYQEDQWQDILLVGHSRHNLLVMVFTHRQTNGLYIYIYYIYMIIMKAMTAMTYERDDVMKWWIQDMRMFLPQDVCPFFFGLGLL